eukprot:4998-Eustigmatos_ZCMA.PRE.1
MVSVATHSDIKSPLLTCAFNPPLDLPQSLKVRATHRSMQRSMDVESQASYAIRERPVAPET